MTQEGSKGVVALLPKSPLPESEPNLVEALRSAEKNDSSDDNRKSIAGSAYNKTKREQAQQILDKYKVSKAENATATRIKAAPNTNSGCHAKSIGCSRKPSAVVARPTLVNPFAPSKFAGKATTGATTIGKAEQLAALKSRQAELLQTLKRRRAALGFATELQGDAYKSSRKKPRYWSTGA